jgi:hypothetical protein
MRKELVELRLAADVPCGAQNRHRIMH